MKYKILWAIIATFFLGGCVVTDPYLSKSGWKYSQQSELLEILKTDKYASLCELRPIYEKYLQNKNPKLFNKLLVGYVQNLANSCISVSSFKASQRAKKAGKTKTHYEIQMQSAKASSIMLQLQSGKSIEDILKPYIPTSPQFNRLLLYYHSMRSGGDSKQLQKVKLNIERTKLMKPSSWSTFVLINVPEYKFRLFEMGGKKMEFAVVVGNKKWQTPIFTSTLKYVVLNPTWNVPDNIARDELIPKIIRNPNILKRKNMVVRKDYNINSPHVDPRSVNWKLYLTKAYKKKNLPHKLIQKSSGRNALGTVKFMFPNRFAVYMHDTQAKSLFKKKHRAYSHGCIRLSKPQKLLKHVSNNYTSHGFDTINKRSNTKKTNYINLKQHIPVKIVYLTAYVDEGGTLKFFNDVYGFDSSQKLRGTP
ncbi:MAG: L,D-transpeptidase family protein [Sulfurovum sp.]|nr:L,D-transpeptidase family protein [Sulfurovum sp.]